MLQKATTNHSKGLLFWFSCEAQTYNEDPLTNLDHLSESPNHSVDSEGNHVKFDAVRSSTIEFAEAE